MNHSGFLKGHIRADGHAINNLDDPLTQRENDASPVGRWYQDANASSGEILLSEQVSVRCDQQIESALHFVQQSAVFDILPADILVIDGLDRVSLQGCSQLDRNVLSRRILNATQP
jgi:hypothetical protein